jgi:hypothetical protein
VKGPAAQISESFGNRKEGSSSGLPRVIFVPGAGLIDRAGPPPRERRRGRRRRSPSVFAVARELRAERARTDPS